MKLKKLLVLFLLLGSAFILSACGEQGLPGETGAQGDKGQTGDKGPTGSTGENGADGLRIEFSFTSEGIAWRYVGSKEWNIAIGYADIFSVVNDIKAVERIKEYGFDYVVDSSCSNLTAGTEQEMYGETLVFGETLFADLESAFAAAKTASEASNYEGLKIFINKGEYTTATLEADSVELFGPNFDIDPNSSNSRSTEALIMESLIIDADNVTINGLGFALDGQVKAHEMGGVDNLTIKYCNFLAESNYNASIWGRIELMWKRDVDTTNNSNTYTDPNNCEDYSNLSVEYCRFESNGKRLQNVYAMQLNGLKLLNNTFIGSSNSYYDDCVKITEYVSEKKLPANYELKEGFKTYSFIGEAYIEGNTFVEFGQYVLWFTGYGPSSYIVKNNYFENCGQKDTNQWRGVLTIVTPITSLFYSESGAVVTPVENAKLSVLFTKNEVINSNAGVRIAYQRMLASQLDLKVNYNSFEGFAEEHNIIYNSDDIAEIGAVSAIDASNNYFDITVSASNFTGCSSYLPVVSSKGEALK